jgi:hypothetical protein
MDNTDRLDHVIGQLWTNNKVGRKTIKFDTK